MGGYTPITCATSCSLEDLFQEETRFNYYDESDSSVSDQWGEGHGDEYSPSIAYTSTTEGFSSCYLLTGRNIRKCQSLSG